jgi:hypothetical protein
MMLCQYCKTFDFEKLFEGKPEEVAMMVQPTGMELSKSAQEGCELCHFFLRCASDRESSLDMKQKDRMTTGKLECRSVFHGPETSHWRLFIIKDFSDPSLLSSLDPVNTGILEVLTTGGMKFHLFDLRLGN